MASTQSPTPPSEPPEPKRIPALEWAQRINGEYASVVRWVALIGFVIFASQNHLEIAAAFGGLIPVSLTIGKL